LKYLIVVVNEMLLGFAGLGVADEDVVVKVDLGVVVVVGRASNGLSREKPVLESIL
jgi:hypothetical protein